MNDKLQPRTIDLSTPGNREIFDGLLAFGMAVDVLTANVEHMNGYMLNAQNDHDLMQHLETAQHRDGRVRAWEVECVRLVFNALSAAYAVKEHADKIKGTLPDPKVLQSFQSERKKLLKIDGYLMLDELRDFMTHRRFPRVVCNVSRIASDAPPSYQVLFSADGLREYIDKKGSKPRPLTALEYQEQALGGVDVRSTLVCYQTDYTKLHHTFLLEAMPGAPDQSTAGGN